MLGKFELLTQASHEAIEEWFTVVDDDVSRYATPIDNVRPNKANGIFLFYFPQWNCFCLFGEVISSNKDVGVTSR